MSIEDELTRIRSATRVLVLLADQNEEDVNSLFQLAGYRDGIARHDDLLALAAGELDCMVRKLLERIDGAVA